VPAWLIRAPARRRAVAPDSRRRKSGGAQMQHGRGWCGWWATRRSNTRPQGAAPRTCPHHAPGHVASSAAAAAAAPAFATKVQRSGVTFWTLFATSPGAGRRRRTRVDSAARRARCNRPQQPRQAEARYLRFRTASEGRRKLPARARAQARRKGLSLRYVISTLRAARRLALFDGRGRRRPHRTAARTTDAGPCRCGSGAEASAPAA
jgi:hypothetical protein